MGNHTVTSRKFNQDVGAAKKAAVDGPVVITDRGRPAHVLLTFEAYQQMQMKSKSIGELLSMPGVEDIDLESVLPSRCDVGRDIHLA